MIVGRHESSLTAAERVHYANGDAWNLEKSRQEVEEAIESMWKVDAFVNTIDDTPQTTEMIFSNAKTRSLLFTSNVGTNCKIMAASEAVVLFFNVKFSNQLRPRPSAAPSGRKLQIQIWYR